MQTNYTTYRGERINLCFGCAVKAVMRGEIVVDLIAGDDEEYYCDDCAEGQEWIHEQNQ